MQPKLASFSVYGKELTDLNFNEEGVPAFLPVVIDFLCANTKHQGVFRKCGDITNITNLGILLSCPQVALPPSSSINDAASFLKQWLRELPEPLLTPFIINAHFNNNEPSSVVQVLRKLQDPNRKTLAYIFRLIKEILDNSEANFMNFSNIQTCFLTALNQSNSGITIRFNFKFFYTVAIELLNEKGTDFDLTKPILKTPLLLEETKSLDNLTKRPPIPNNASGNNFNKTAPIVRPRQGAKNRKRMSFAEDIDAKEYFENFPPQ